MRKNWKRLVGLAGAMVLVISLVGCTSVDTEAPAETPAAETPTQEEETAAPVEEKEETSNVSEKKPSAETLSAKGNEPYEIVVIEKNLTNPIWVALQEGALQAGEDAGVKVTVLAPNTAESNEEQISLIQQSIAKGVDALVVIPADGTGIVPAIAEANAAGIPVINVDTRIDSTICKIESFIAVENYTAGVEAAEALAAQMQEAGDVIILEGKPGTQSSIDIVGGANDVFAKYDGINVVASQAANWNRTDGYNVALNLLEANPDAKAIFAANDEMAMGALQAVQQAGKDGEMFVAGLNANPDAVEAVKAGQLSLTYDKNGNLQGYSAVMAAVMVLNGEEIETEYEVPGILIEE